MAERLLVSRSSTSKGQKLKLTNFTLEALAFYFSHSVVLALEATWPGLECT